MATDKNPLKITSNKVKFLILILFVFSFYLLVVNFFGDFLFEINNNYDNNKILIIAASNYFNEKEVNESFSKCSHFKCKIEIHSEFSNEKAESAQVIIYFFSQYQESTNKIYNYTLKRYNPNQITIGWTMESGGLYRFEGNSNFIISNFNITAGYPRVNDFNKQTHIYVPYGPVEYSGSDSYAHSAKFHEIKEIPPKRNNSIVWISSNCWHEDYKRVDLMRSIMNITKVDSYGSCLNNIDFTDQDKLINSKHDQKMNVLKRYNFAIAFENSLCKDYITEKLWESLSVGTIPIYLGAPNIMEFLPDPGSIINVRDFKSVNDLVDYIKKVENDQNLRLKHLKWIKIKKWSKEFQNIYDESVNNLNPLCSICSKIASKQILIPKQSPFLVGNESNYTLPLLK
ncbi:hypothetical protein ACTFIR_010553 [Dictyostelium discoideum]